MPEPEHPTRLALLDAGLGLAEGKALSALSIDEVVRRAGVAKGTFYVHFRERSGYLAALHGRFHDELRTAIAAAMGDLGPGADRLRRGTLAYLDGCLAARGVKAMLVQARGLPEIGRQVATTNDAFAHQVEPDLAAMGSPHPLESARLYVAMSAEVALLELDAGAPLPALRTALFAHAAAPGTGAGDR